MTTVDALFDNGVYPLFLSNESLTYIIKVNGVFREWFRQDDPTIDHISFTPSRDQFLKRIENESIFPELSLSITHRNGNKINCLATAYRVEENKETMILFILHDSLISSKESAALKSRSANLYTLSENIEDAYWSVDTGFRVIEFNRKFSDMLASFSGYTIKKGDTVHEKIRDFMKVPWEERFEKALKREKQEYTDSFLGGTMVTTVMPILSDYGEVIGVCSTIKDMTAELNRRKNLEVLHNRFNSILNSSADAAIIATDPQGIIRQFNQGASQMLGYEQDEIIGKTDLLSFYAPSFIRTVRNFICTKTGRQIKMSGLFSFLSENPEMVRNLEWKLLNKKGKTLDVKISISPVLMDDLSYAGVLIIAQDITELNRVKEELERAKLQAEETSRIKTSFLANMSHEIRTPLNGIIGMADLLNRTELSMQQKSQLSIVLKSANTLLLLINDILDYTRIEAGKFKLGHSSFRVRNLLKDIQDMLIVNIEGRDIDFDVKIDKSVTDQVIGDPRRIKQILMNLVGNAMKFTIEGSINVEVYQINKSKGRLCLYFKVIDTGIGISHEEKNKLFQTFSQVDTSATRKYGGSGLGLAISKELVMMMDGEIGMESTPGRGSTFWFTVHLEGDTTELEKRHALVINRNRISRRALSRLLRTMHLSVREVSHSEEIPEGENFDFVFMDGCQSPEFPEQLKNAKGSQIILTSFSSDTSREGYDCVLKLPTTESQLEDCMHLMLQKSKSSLDMNSDNGESDEEQLHKNEFIKVLVAEDNKINQLVAMNFLKKLGYTATLVENGRDAVDACRKEQYHVVLMDQMMPGMDGIEATREIRQLGSGSPNTDTIIIALTANAMKGDKEVLINAGMDDYIAKPVLLNEIKTVLERNLLKKGII